MTYEEAIKHFQSLQKRYTTEHNGKMCEKVALALEAMEKQVPKKPYKDNENGVYEKDYCPTCNRSLFPNDHHCPCGQALLWEDIE